jgi:hypothetical protein
LINPTIEYTTPCSPDRLALLFHALQKLARTRLTIGEQRGDLFFGYSRSDGRVVTGCHPVGDVAAA